MASDRIQSIINLLEDIKTKSEYCIKCHDQSQVLLRKISQNMTENCSAIEKCDHESHNKFDCEDVGGRKVDDYLENILFEKIQENSKLKILNGRLLLSSREKSHKIKDLSRKISPQCKLNSKSKNVSSYKDKIGKFNVEIQKLKKQLDIETKKLHKEKARKTKLRKDFTFSDGGKKLFEISKKVEAARKMTNPHHVTKSSFKNLDEIFIQKSLLMIKLNDEPSIRDETFDEPENLDSDTEEKMSDESFNESSDDLLKESSDADNEISS